MSRAGWDSLSSAPLRTAIPLHMACIGSAVLVLTATAKIDRLRKYITRLVTYLRTSRYYEDVADDRAVSALEAVLPASARMRVAERLDRETVVELAGRRLRIRWVPIGWPRQVRD